MSRTTGKAHGWQNADRLQALWDDLLSRKPKRVQSAYASLDASEKRAVMAHLQRMASEPGWLPEQRASAESALSALQGQPK